jgi:hypothetical protein
MPVTVPDWVPVIGGQPIGPSDQQPAAPVDTTTRDQYLNQFAAAHQGAAGQPTAVVDKNGDPVAAGTKHYSFADGSWVEINPDGSVWNQSVVKAATPAQTAPTTKQYKVTNPDGSSDSYQYRWDAAAQTAGKDPWILDTSFPVEHTPAPKGQLPPSDPSKWQPIRADPSDPNSRVLALQDPSTGQRVDLPAGAQPTRPQVVQGDKGAMYSWDGTTLSPLLPSTPDKPQLVQGANGLLQSWDGKSLTTLQAGQPTPLTTNTTDPKIVMRDASGAITTVDNPNYQKPVGTFVGGGSTGDQYILSRDPTTGAVSQQPNPNYVAPRPSQLSADTTSPFITTMTSDGQMAQQPNPNFAPKTQADVAGAVARLQQQAQAKQQELAAKIGQNGYTGQQAASEFDQWWNQSVEPQKAYLATAQQQAAQDQARLQAEQQRLNLQTAQYAGSQAIQAAQAQLPYTVGPGFGAALNNIQQAYASGKAPGNIDLGSAVTFQMPDINQLAQQATNQALAHISQSAASGMNTATGPNTPNFNPSFGQQPNLDVNQALNAQTYQPGSPPPPPPVQPPPQLPGPQPIVGTPLNFGNTLQQGTGPLPPYAPQQPGTYGVLTGAMPSMLPAYVPGG